MPPKHENGGKKRPQNHKVGAESTPHKSELKQCGGKKCRQNAKGGQKAPSKQQSDGKKRHHSNQREKRYGGGKCHQNGKVVAENATKSEKRWQKVPPLYNSGGTSIIISVIVVGH